MQGWEEIVARLDGPLHFRFIGQPLMASALAITDGVKDAKFGKPAYFWAVLTTPGHREELMKDGWKSICKVAIVAMVLEVVYQVMIHHVQYRGYFLAAAFVLAICPYLILRGPINRLVRVIQMIEESRKSTARQ